MKVTMHPSDNASRNLELPLEEEAKSPVEPEEQEVWERKNPKRCPRAKDKPNKSRLLEWEARKRRKDKSNRKTASLFSSVGSVVNPHDERKEDT